MSDGIILIFCCAMALVPKARAGCVNAARPDPCGGPPARAVPTATSVRLLELNLFVILNVSSNVPEAGLWV